MTDEKRPPWQTCAHNGTFDESVCWAITNPDLADKETEAKFCPARVDGMIRRFGHPNMGFMEPKQNDWMVTKVCSGKCGQPILLRVEEDTCLLCKEAEQLNKPILG
jgi:hypothetical protein